MVTQHCECTLKKKCIQKEHGTSGRDNWDLASLVLLLFTYSKFQIYSKSSQKSLINLLQYTIQLQRLSVCSQSYFIFTLTFPLHSMELFLKLYLGIISRIKVRNKSENSKTKPNTYSLIRIHLLLILYFISMFYMFSLSHMHISPIFFPPIEAKLCISQTSTFTFIPYTYHIPYTIYIPYSVVTNFRNLALTPFYLYTINIPILSVLFFVVFLSSPVRGQVLQSVISLHFQNLSLL